MSTPARGRGKTAPKKVRRAENQAKAMKLRVDGWSSDEIAERLGVHRVTVHRWVRAGLDELAAEIRDSAEQLRAIQAKRLEQDIRKLHEIADRDGDLGAYRALRGLYERQARLLGLDLVPEPGAAQIPTTIRIEMRTPQDRDDVIELPAETPDNAEFEVIGDEGNDD